MIWLGLLFLLIAIVAAIFGFGNLAAGLANIAIILFWVFIVLFVVSLVFRFVRRY